MSEVKPYYLGETGEWVLDQLESLLEPNPASKKYVVCQLTRVMAYEDAWAEVEEFLMEDVA